MLVSAVMSVAVILMVVAVVSVPHMAMASVGTRTPIGQIHADMFPVGSEQMVDYCHFLNVRRGAGPRYAAFTHLSRFDRVTVLEFRNRWVRIDTDRGEGWIFAAYLSRETAAVAPLPSGGTASTVRVANRTPSSLLTASLFPVNSRATVDFCHFLNVRRGPSMGYAAFTHLTNGTVITVREFRNRWVRFETTDGQTGWVWAGYLSNADVLEVRRVPTASNVGTRTPIAELTAARFPVNSTQIVDYCHFLNVRDGAGMGYSAFTHLARGDSITVLEFRNRWVRISVDGREGWIFAAYLRAA